MAREITASIESGRHLIVQAGTGTGKSLGYLVPVALSGRRTVVATYTKALQDQLAQFDLPLVASVLEEELGRELSFAVLKGRSNYLCLQRIDELTDRIAGLNPDAVYVTHYSQVTDISAKAATLHRQLDLLVALALTHVTIVAVTVFLHRCQAHRSLDLHPIASHFFRCWLWMTTGMVTKEWAAIHRKHHAKCETVDDPHSPQIYGINRVLWLGVFLYVKESYNPETLERYGHGTPETAIVGLGGQCFVRPNSQDAVREFRQALRLKPDYPEAANNLGVALLQGGRPAPEDIVVYKSVGIGLEDIALAGLVWQRLQGQAA
mgnify:CR=1 FL=1